MIADPKYERGQEKIRKQRKGTYIMEIGIGVAVAIVFVLGVAIYSSAKKKK